MLALFKFIKVIELLRIESLDISFSSGIENFNEFSIKIDNMLFEGKILPFCVILLELSKVSTGKRVILHKEGYVTVNMHYHFLLLLLRSVFSIIDSPSR
jgi:hypothetical protein